MRLQRETLRLEMRFSRLRDVMGKSFATDAVRLPQRVSVIMRPKWGGVMR